jgi:hypothetical protein
VFSENMLCRILVGRHVDCFVPSLTALQSQCADEAASLEQSTRDSWKGPVHCFWIVVCIVSAFWGLMAFDMIGDTSGSSEEDVLLARTLLVSMMILPCSVMCIIWTYRSYSKM